MSAIPKHEATTRPRKGKKQLQPTVDPAAGHRDSSCVAEAIDGLASIFSTWVTQERNGDNGSALYSSPNGYPVKVALADDEQSLTLFFAGDAVDSIADSLKRIADAMTAQRAAGGEKATR